MTRVLGWLAVLAALVLAAFLAVLAVDVLRWRGHLEEADVRRAGSPGNTELWVAETVLPSDPARSLLALDDDVAVRAALQTFRLGRPGFPARNQGELAVRAQADLRLSDVARDDPGVDVRSRAEMLRGILALEEARVDQTTASAALRRSLTQLRRAIRLDDANSDAKYDLELVLRLIRSTEEERPPGSRESRRRGGSQGQGAGSSREGAGF
jgi:hypothetical protein